MKVFLLSLTLVSCAALPPPQIKWHVDEVVALKRAHQLGKPVVIDFSANWCDYCYQLERNVFRNESVGKKVMKDYVPLTLDVSNWESASVASLRRKYDVQGVPYVVILNRDGSIRARFYYNQMSSPQLFLSSLGFPAE